MIENIIFMQIQTVFETNLSISIESLIVLLTAGGCIVIAAKEARVAIMLAVLLYVSEFIIFYEMGIEYIAALISFLMAIVLLSVSLLLPHQKLSIGVV